MSIKYALVLLSTMLIVQPVFADEDMSSDFKPCKAIVKACKEAGYERHGSHDKNFWKDCMKPLILGKTVSGVSVDDKDIKACRTGKIKRLKYELKELQSVK